ncbi:hypothetical protein BD779DRAFT_372951 [Infundibulicybe gibba]|nr:hypothetical protein BD779DRAFT_372951 [Infundibulicybe gibba]
MILVNDELIHNSRAGRHLRDLKHEISEMLEAEASSLKTIENLNDQLELYKRAYADANAENKKNEKIKIEVEKQRDDLESQLKGYRIITLIDGDGAIFSKDLLAQGQPGGDIAARRLSNAITSHLNEKYGVNQYQIWVYIFFNKCGLLNTLRRHGLDAQSSRFDDFMAGFNMAAERFLMVDVGNAKEAADAKIKVHLEDDIRLSQTYKIIFGGCHDNGYVTTLRSQITAGYKNKLILLRTYDDAATGVTDLELPLMAVPDLFMPQKLGTGGGIPPALTNRSHSPTTPMFPPGLSPRGSTAASTWRPSIPSTYSSMTQTISKQGGTSEFDYHGSNASNEQKDDVLPKPMSPRARHVNPDLVNFHDIDCNLVQLTVSSN